MAVELAQRQASEAPRSRTRTGLRREAGTDLSSRGEPAMWMLGGALALGILMIVGFLALVVFNGALAFWPRPIEAVRLADGTLIAGEPRRSQSFRPPQSEL